MLELYYMEIAPFLEEQFRSAASLYVDDQRRKKAEKCVKPEDQARSICCGLLLQLALKQHRAGKDEKIPDGRESVWTSTDPDKEKEGGALLGGHQGIKEEILSLSFDSLSPVIPITYQYGKNGKPYWVNWESDDLHVPAFFNLSHSGDYVVLAVADQEVGVDVQKKCPIKDSLAKRVLSADEYRQYWDCFEQKGAEEAHRYFFFRWTQKESVVKLTGDGLGRDFRLVREDGCHNPEGGCHNSEEAEIFCYSRELDEEHFLSVSVYDRKAVDEAFIEKKTELLYRKKMPDPMSKFIHVRLRIGE